jgi:hypothetical protein
MAAPTYTTAAPAVMAAPTYVGGYGVAEIDKVNAFGQVVERDFMAPAVAAPRANPNNLLAGGVVVSERLISVDELASQGRFFEDAPVSAGMAVSQPVMAAAPIVYETYEQPVVEYVTAPTVEYVNAAPAVEYVTAAPQYVSAAPAVEYVSAAPQYVTAAPQYVGAAPAYY